MAKPKRTTMPAPDDAFNDAAFVVEAATRAMRMAAKAAVEENNRLGITSYGTVNGIIVEMPPQKPPARD
jgi:hypothetical protein